MFATALDTWKAPSVAKAVWLDRAPATPYERH